MPCWNQDTVAIYFLLSIIYPLFDAVNCKPDSQECFSRNSDWFPKKSFLSIKYAVNCLCSTISITYSMGGKVFISLRWIVSVGLFILLIGTTVINCHFVGKIPNLWFWNFSFIIKKYILQPPPITCSIRCGIAFSTLLKNH